MPEWTVMGPNGYMSLHWRHNGRDGISDHQPHYCLLNRLSRRRSKRTSKIRATGLCAGNSPLTGEIPAHRASNAENVSICWRHHVSPNTNVTQCDEGYAHEDNGNEPTLSVKLADESRYKGFPVILHVMYMTIRMALPKTSRVVFDSDMSVTCDSRSSLCEGESHTSPNSDFWISETPKKRSPGTILIRPRLTW